MRPFLKRLLTARSTASPFWLPCLVIASVVPVLAFLALMVPPNEVPDEVAHILRADSVRHGEIAGFRRPRLDDQGDPAVDVAVRADLGLLAAGIAFTPGTPLSDKRLTQVRREEMEHAPWIGTLEAVSVPNTAVYPPLLYIPAALGLQLAAWLGGGPYRAILTARLANAVLYALLGVAAIRLARRGQGILFAVLCLPMSLWLAASVNHDGLVIACAALSGALLTRPGWRGWWGGTVLLAVAAMAKPFLLPLALIVPAAVPGGVRRHAGWAAAGFAVAAGPALAWDAAMALYVAAPFVRGPAQPAGPLWSGPPGTLFPTTNPGAQAHILLAAPARLVTLPLDSAWANGRWLWREAIGVLGTLDVFLPASLYAAWGWALAGAALAGFVAGRGGQEKVPLLPAAAAVIGAVASAWLTFIVQYVSWTSVGNALVEGVQGRYLLPIAALALPVATLPVLRLPGGRGLRAALAAPAVMLALAGIAILLLVVVRTYYIR
jgi:GNAT superfamily N-acetyltransferase